MPHMNPMMERRDAMEKQRAKFEKDRVAKVKKGLKTGLRTKIIWGAIQEIGRSKARSLRDISPELEKIEASIGSSGLNGEQKKILRRELENAVADALARK